MANEAKLKNIPPEGFEGGIIVDEMSIQSDLQIEKRKGTIQLVGLIDCNSAKHPDLFLPVDGQYFCIFATVVGKAIS
jgi:hypothetical protein